MTDLHQQPSGDRLELLYRVSQAFNSSLDLPEVLNRVMDEVIAAVHAERGFLMLVDEQEQFTFHAARGVEQQSIEAPEFEVSRGIVEHVAATGEPLLTLDAQADDWLSQRSSVSALGLRSVLCVPLRLKDTTLGVIYVDNRVQSGAFSPDDLDLLASIASSAVIAIENARLYQVAVEKGRMEKELQVAREVQRSLLPIATPQVPGWEFAAWWQPAREVSGDFYDFLLVGERTGVVIGDVSDKGMPAALFMALTRSTLRGSVGPALSAAECIRQANEIICQDAANGMFVSLFYALLDPTGEMTYVNAGHNPPLCYSAADSEFYELARTGIVLGIGDWLEYTEERIALGPGDFLFLYTDGVTEAINPDTEEYGKERLCEVLLDNAGAPAKAILRALEADMTQFIKGTPQFDDITVLVAAHTG